MVKLQQSACFLLLVTLCQSVAKYANLDRKTTKYPNPNGKGKTWPVLHCVYWMQRWFPLYHPDYQVPRAWRSQLRLFYSHIAIFISALATKIVCILEIIPIKKGIGLLCLILVKDFLNWQFISRIIMWNMLLIVCICRRRFTHLKKTPLHSFLCSFFFGG